MLRQGMQSGGGEGRFAAKGLQCCGGEYSQVAVERGLQLRDYDVAAGNAVRWR
jgi:hypothetical protein